MCKNFKIIIYFILTLLAVPALCAQEDAALKGASEISLYGGLSVSTKDKTLQGKDIEYGGSGYNLGVTALMFVTEHILAGIDFSYSDNGYGERVFISGDSYRAATQHVRPLFFVKAHLFPRSPLRLYFPFGVGMDFTRVRTRQNNDDYQSDSAAGLALTAGAGFEFDVAQNIFLGMEGRYVYSNYFGRGGIGVNNTGSVEILFKAGIRFRGDFFGTM